MAEDIIIAITSAEGCDTHRARVMGTKCIATCTMGENQAAEAVAQKYVDSTIFKGRKWHLENLTGREYRLVIEAAYAVKEETEGRPAEAGTTNKLPPNTCVKWPYRACGGGCDDKGCCTCKDKGCNSRQTCANPGEQPYHDHQDGWPTPPDEIPQSAIRNPQSAAPVLLDAPAPARVTAMHCNSAQTAITAVSFPASLDTVRKALDLQMLPTAEAAGEYIRDQVRGERICGLRSSIYCALIRRQLFPEKYQFNEFCAWMEEHAGVKWRMAVLYQNAGNLLLSPEFADLTREMKMRILGCTAAKLEIIGAAPKERLAEIAAQPELEDLSPGQIRDVIKDMLLTGQERKVLEAAKEKKADKDSPAGRIGTAAGNILRWTRDFDEMTLADPLPVLQAGLALHKAALDRLEKRNDLPPKKWAVVIADLEATLAFAKDLFAKGV